MIRGIPRPDVTWTKDNITLSSNDRLTISFTMEGLSIVRIESTEQEDSGVYSCTASNAAGSVTRIATVKFKDNGKNSNAICIMNHYSYSYNLKNRSLLPG